jgi:hypothetical protein
MQFSIENGYIFTTSVWKHTEITHLHTMEKNNGIQCYSWWICYQMNLPVSRTEKNAKRKLLEMPEIK